MEATVLRGKIVLTPKSVVDRSSFPNADDEYTLEQRRAIDAQLDEAAKGPFFGPFDNVNEAIAHMKKQLKQKQGTLPTKTKRPR